MSSKWDHSEDEVRHHPESLMMSYGYLPEWSEGSLKSPIFQTSTFVFRTAEEGKAFFEVAYGLREPAPDEKVGLIYSRLNNPDLEILEDRLCVWDDAEAALAFKSGMAAISTSLWTFLRPGDALAFSRPIYGGTDHLIRTVIPEFGIDVVGFPAGTDEEGLERLLAERGVADRLKMIFVETPANPTNRLVDIEMCARVAARHSTAERRVLVAVDNTFLGPVYQHPLAHGADLVIYSATKFIGGHSDLIAGACLGPEDVVAPIRAMRTFLGTMTGPWTGWLLMRSLETLKLRMDRQVENAGRLARFLVGHAKVSNVHYLGLLRPGDPEFDVYKRQCLRPGSMISFEVPDGEAGAFRFLNALKMVKLAVSLGGTESLAEHPATMTHADVPPEELARLGAGPSLVRISVGIEHGDDLVADIGQALDAV